MTNINVLPAAPPSETPPAPAAMTVEAAQVRRSEMLADKAIGKKLMEGDAALRAEMSTLNKVIAGADDTAGRLVNAMAGTPAAGIEHLNEENPLTTSELYQAVKGLRETGLTDAVIKDVVLGTPISREQHDAFEVFKKRCLSDREWVKRFRSGDMDARRDFNLFSAGVIAPVAEAK